MRILAATDLSARSDRAVARSFSLARDLGAELRLLHVVDADLPDDLRAHSVEWAQSTLASESAKLAALAGVTASAEVVIGKAVTEIVAESQRSRTDLIVLGMHDFEADAGKSMDAATAGRVLKESLPAVLLVTGDASSAYRNVVVGIDFSIFTSAAVKQAFRFAPAAFFHFVHAYHVPFKGFLSSKSFANEVAYEERLELDSFLSDQMEALGQRIEAEGVAPGLFEKVMVEGDPSSVLHAECRRVGADLLVIGTHSRPGTSRSTWGRVASDLLNAPPCDVLVIRPY